MKEIIGIECKNCGTNWRLEIPISKVSVEAFATLCTCGNIIVGNIRNNLVLDAERLNESMKEKYLTNGSFQIISLDLNVVEKLPLLELE